MAKGVGVHGVPVMVGVRVGVMVSVGVTVAVWVEFRLVSHGSFTVGVSETTGVVLGVGVLVRRLS